MTEIEKLEAEYSKAEKAYNSCGCTVYKNRMQQIKAKLKRLKNGG